MDARAFKVGKENKKAEAKKVLLWMLLMVFAVLIVVLIVYMSYNRYMPSFLEWFKKEENVVLEPVEMEIKMEQNVINAFVELEKTISGALSIGKPVEIMLDIKEIESKLKDVKNKQYNLAFEGQKIKLIDKSIVGSISEQTVMEFAITTDKGIWVKADFSKIDNNNLPNQLQITNYDYDKDDECFNFLKELKVSEIEKTLSAKIESNFPNYVNCESQINNNKYYNEITEFLKNENNCYYELNFGKRTVSDSRRKILYDSESKKLLITDIEGKTDKSHDIDLLLNGNLNKEDNLIILNNEEFNNNIITIEKQGEKAILNIYSSTNVRYQSLNSKIEYVSAQFSCENYNKAMKDIQKFNECLKEYEKQGKEIVPCNGFQNKLKFNHDTNIIEFYEIKDTDNVYPFKWDIDKIFKIEELDNKDYLTRYLEYDKRNYLKVTSPLHATVYLSKRAYSSEQKCWKVLDANHIKIYPTINEGKDFKHLEIKFTEEKGTYLIIEPNKLCEYKEPLVNFLQFIRNPDKNDFIFKNRQIVILKEYWDFFGNEYKQIYEDNYLTKYIDFKIKIDNDKVLSTSYDSKNEVVGNNFQQISLVYNLNGECIEMPIPEFEFDSEKIKQIYKINCPYDHQICINSLEFSEFKLKKIKQGEDYKLVIAFKDSWGCLEEYDSEPYIDAFNYLQVVYTFNSFIFYDKYHIKYDNIKEMITDNFGNDIKDYKIELKINSFPKISKWNSEESRFLPFLRSNYLIKKIIVNLDNRDVLITNANILTIEAEKNIILKNINGLSYLEYYPEQLYIYTCGNYENGGILIITNNNQKLIDLRKDHCR